MREGCQRLVQDAEPVVADVEDTHGLCRGEQRSGRILHAHGGQLFDLALAWRHRSGSGLAASDLALRATKEVYAMQQRCNTALSRAVAEYSTPNGARDVRPCESGFAGSVSVRAKQRLSHKQNKSTAYTCRAHFVRATGPSPHARARARARHCMQLTLQAQRLAVRRPLLPAAAPSDYCPASSQCQSPPSSASVADWRAVPCGTCSASLRARQHCCSRARDLSSMLPCHAHSAIMLTTVRCSTRLRH